MLGLLTRPSPYLQELLTEVYMYMYVYSVPFIQYIHVDAKNHAIRYYTAHFSCSQPVDPVSKIFVGDREK